MALFQRIENFQLKIIFKNIVVCFYLKKYFFQIHLWSSSLQPIADHFLQTFKDLLNLKPHPDQHGEHSNSAFGLIFLYEYANCKQP